MAALNNINLKVSKGEFITIIGSNGAGKSTLLNAVSGNIIVDSGSIVIGGNDVSKAPDYERARYIGSITQDPMGSTASMMSIEENLAMALMRGQTRGVRTAVTKKRKELFHSLLSDIGLGLEKRLSVKVGTLSGGQRQALALVMATIAQPEVLLLDEHTAALDPKVAKQVMEITNSIVGKYSLTTLMITHNMEQAIKNGNRLVMLHEGRIILDIKGEEKEQLTVSQLIEKFTQTSGKAFDDDRVLLVAEPGD